MSETSEIRKYLPYWGKGTGPSNTTDVASIPKEGNAMLCLEVSEHLGIIFSPIRFWEFCQTSLLPSAIPQWTKDLQTLGEEYLD